MPIKGVFTQPINPVEHPEQKLDEVKMPPTQYKHGHLDPRPDIQEDHVLWLNTLAEASMYDKDTWGFMHGLRCGGARLTKESDGSLKLKVSPLYIENGGDWPREELRSKWLDPYSFKVSAVLAKTARRLAG